MLNVQNALLCSGLVALAASPVAAEKPWVLTSEGAAQFELPQKPVRTTRTRRTGMGSIKDVRFEVKRGAGFDIELWHVSVSTLPKRMLKHPRDLIYDASWRGGFGRAAGARPTPGKKDGKAVRAKLAGKRVRGRRYTLESGGTVTSSAFYLVGEKLYAFHYMRGKDADDERRFDRLLGSFSLKKKAGR